MTAVGGAASPLDALLQRLGAAAAELLPGEPAGDLPTAGQEGGALLWALVEQLQNVPQPSDVWLLLVALSATFPHDSDVCAVRRRLELSSTSGACEWLLEWAYAAAGGRSTGHERIRLVTDAVFVDVDFTARHDLQTGVQRVVRRLLPRWDSQHDVVLAVWAEGEAALRELTAMERERVLRWTGPLGSEPALSTSPLLVPWRSTVVLPEVPGGEQCSRLTGLALHSGNRVAVIGHDCIPVVSTDLMPDSEPVKFVRFLTLVKHAAVVATVSSSSAAEFGGFVSALSSQGLRGPRVVCCPLGSDAPISEPGPRKPTDQPEILVVGSHEPRKNHLAVLHAAELLWRRGLQFRLRFIGAGGWTTDAFDHQLQRLIAGGRPVTADRGRDDAQLWDAFRRARFSVFPSLHEGFGLPVVESLSLGTPVIGTAYGSIAEVAAGGGVLLVDPHDDLGLAAAMQRLLCDDDALEALRAAAAARPVRSWNDYASELWEQLVVAR